MAQLVIGLDGPIAGGKSEFAEFLKNNHELLKPFLEEGRKVIAVPEFLDFAALQLFYLMRKEPDKNFAERCGAWLKENCFKDGQFQEDKYPLYLQYIAELFNETRELASGEARKIFTKLYEKSCLTGRQVRYTTAKFSRHIHVFDKTMIGGAESYCRNSYEEGNLCSGDYEEYIRDLKWGLDSLGREQQDRWLERLVVYFRLNDYEIARERLEKKRKTPGEIVPKEYWENVNKWCEHAFLEPGPKKSYGQYRVKPPEVLEVDGSTDIEKDPGFHVRVLEQMVDKLTEMGLNKR